MIKPETEAEKQTKLMQQFLSKISFGNGGVNHAKPNDARKTSQMTYQVENNLNYATPKTMKTAATTADLTQNQDTTAQPANGKKRVTKTKQPSKTKWVELLATTSTTLATNEGVAGKTTN